VIKLKSIEEQLILHEGMKLKPYRCPAGKLTIGVGRNLEDKGLSKQEALFLLRRDIAEVTNELRKYPWFETLDMVRQKVLIDMAFNLGINGLLSFKKMLSYLKAGDYEKAADEMVNSRWYGQVGDRSKRLVKMMRTGEDYKN
jgi:lysozyme